MNKKIRVLIVDDSALIRQLLTTILNADSNIEVIGACEDPVAARNAIKTLKPDVLTLDVEMPKMDGITFLKNLMRLHPLPVIMISTLTKKNADVTLEALTLGAIDYIAKPDDQHSLTKYAEEITRKVREAARANVNRLQPSTASTSQVFSPVQDIRRLQKKLIAIGASTGGTEAIKDVITMLPASTPGIVITQHIPPVFSASFAKRLDKLSALTVLEATHNQIVLPNHVYIAPGDKHLVIKKKGGQYVCLLQDSAPVNKHKPAVDVMFDSVISEAKGDVLGIILTGMGADGAMGLKGLKMSGAQTVAQDEASSVVWGMPGAAVKANAAQEVLPLNKIAARIMKYANE